MKRILLITFLLGSLSNPVHGMWRSVATRLASAIKTARIKASIVPSSSKPPNSVPKAMQKPVAQVSSGNQKSWFQSVKESISNGWQRLKQNFKIPEWTHDSNL